MRGKQTHHATHWPYVDGLAASAGIWLRVGKVDVWVHNDKIINNARSRSKHVINTTVCCLRASFTYVATFCSGKISQRLKEPSCIKVWTINETASEPSKSQLKSPAITHLQSRHISISDNKFSQIIDLLAVPEHGK